MDILKVLFIGDIIGRLGRKAVKEIVPKLRSQLNLDLVVANIENLAHGSGVTKKTFNEIKDVGIDVFTSGNHIWKQKEGVEMLNEKALSIIRPANYPNGVPGMGFLTISVKGKRVVIINLIGRVFMKAHCDDPFRTFDRIVNQQKSADVIIVDFHAEASSEKKAFAWYVEGRASLVVGTHTHVPTADADIIGEHKLGYITDVGMTGANSGVLGVKKEEIIEHFLTQLPVKHTMIEAGPIVFNSILAEFEHGNIIKIKRIDKIIDNKQLTISRSNVNLKR